MKVRRISYTSTSLIFFISNSMLSKRLIIGLFSTRTSAVNARIPHVLARWVEIGEQLVTNSYTLIPIIYHQSNVCSKHVPI